MSTIEEIIKTYNPETINDNKAILREIVQSIVLVWFDHGAHSHIRINNQDEYNAIKSFVNDFIDKNTVKNA